MKESIHLIGGLLGYVDKHDLFKCVQILNMPNMWHKKFNGWTFMDFYSSNGWTQIVQYLYFGKLG